MQTSPIAAANNQLHQPVLADTCVKLLSPAIMKPNSVLIDCTLGLGGHSEAILKANPDVHVIGIDRDIEAIKLASARLANFGTRFTPVQATYDQIDKIAAKYGKNGVVEAILMDLGVSSLQLDKADRGFSYMHDGPLDMRMDSTGGKNAKEIINNADMQELTRILRLYGEEKFAGKIAVEIVRRRAIQPLETTAQLVSLIREVLPEKAKRTGGNPAKRTFQALRIAVNDELEILEQAVPKAIAALAVKGRLVVESYQSLEDRIVKEAMNHGLQSTTPAGLPVELPDHQPYLKALVRGALKADEQEIAQNPRSQSVRLRAVERIRETPSHLLQNFNPSVKTVCRKYKGETK